LGGGTDHLEGRRLDAAADEKRQEQSMMIKVHQRLPDELIEFCYFIFTA
jgi:hypothetical protein